MRQRLKLFLPIFLMGLITDQLVKYWAVETLKGKPSINLMGGFFRFIFATNKGAWGSAGADLAEPFRTILLIVAPAALLIFLIYFLLKSKEMSKVDLISYSFITSGGIGNVIDRILYNEVVDMFWFGFAQYRYLQTNVFNIADIWIMLGFFLIIFDQLNKYLKSKWQKQ